MASFAANQPPRARGRGLRAGQVTPGLVALQAKQAKNSASAQKRMATMARNQQARTALPLPATPVPASHPNGTASTPSTPRHVLHPLPLPQPVVVQPSPLSLGPPPSRLAFTPAAPTLRGPLTAVNNDHPQEYPNFEHGFSEPQTNFSPQDFNNFLVRLNPSQLMQLMDGATGKCSFPDSVFPDGDSEHAPNGSRLFLPSHNNDDDGVDADNDRTVEPPWNAPQQVDPEPGPEEEVNPHVNAQTSLRVTMQDVQLPRNKRRRESQNDDDDEHDGRQPKRRKKAQNRPQNSRSIKDVAEESQRILTRAFVHLKVEMALDLPWPLTETAAGEDSDAASEIDLMVLDAWAAGCVDILGLVRGSTDVFPEPTTAERNLIRARISQFRGVIKQTVGLLIAVNYGFLDVQSLAEPTAENIEKAIEHNRDLVDTLLGKSVVTGSFLYKDPSNKSLADSICRNPIFQRLLNAVFFGRGQNNRSRYFAGLEELPMVTLALLMCAVMAGIDEWKTGRCVGVKFEFSPYAGKYDECLVYLEDWDKYCMDQPGDNLTTALLCEMLSHARNTSVVPVVVEQVEQKEDTRALALSAFSANQPAQPA
ncbi:hypothetical protein B0H10DRAFT_2218427 [Mycena sp. CBHHK59/15]|nr:hypothetical protein B0H10DRAFT_2218427 [Mycena sp. CBHHK59/15]